MKSAVETLSPTRVKLTVEVPSAELQPRMDAAYKAIAQQVNVPGFRRGKVPARIIDQRFGRGTVVQEAVNEALPGYYTQAMQDNDLRPLGRPELNMTELPVEDGKDLKFEAEIDVVPAIELPDFSALSVEVDPVTVTDEDVQTRLDALRARFGILVGVDRRAAEGDLTSIDLSAVIDGEEIDSVTGVSYEIGSGTMLQGLDDALIGHSAGETVQFSSPLAGGDRAGQVAEVTVTLQSVKERQLPELDDEFAQLASQFDTLEELQAHLHQQAEQGVKFEQGVQARDRVLERMLELTEIPLPENLVDQAVHSHLEGEDRLADEKHRAEVTESTRTAMRTQFLLDALVAREEVDVSQNELIEYLLMAAQQSGMNPNEFAQQIDQRGQVPAMMAEVGRRKALAMVLEQATVTDTDGNPVDLNELVAEGYADDEDDDEDDDYGDDDYGDDGEEYDGEEYDGQQPVEASGEEPERTESQPAEQGGTETEPRS